MSVSWTSYLPSWLKPAFMFKFTAKQTRWLTFIASCFVMIHCSSLYGFSAYSRQLGIALKRTHVAMIGSLGDLGIFLGILVGSFFDRFGIVWTSLLCMLLLPGGYFLCYLTLAGVPSVTLFSLFYFMIGQGSQGLSFICLAANAHNFPAKDRGLVLGFMLAGFQLSPILFTLFFQFVVDFNLEKFYYWASVSCFVSLTMALLFIRKVQKNPRAQYDESQAKYSKAAEDALPLAPPLPPSPPSSSSSSSLTPSLPLPVASPSSSTSSSLSELVYKPASTSSSATSSSNNTPSVSINISSPSLSSISGTNQNGNEPMSNGNGAGNSSGSVGVGEDGLAKGVVRVDYDSDNETGNATLDIYGLQLFKYREFWLIWIALAFQSGAALMLKNSIGNMGLSAGDTAGAVMLLAGFNSASRLVVGFASDYLQHSVPRVAWYLFGGSVMLLGHLAFLLWPSKSVLYFTVITTAIGYGTAWCITSAVLSLYFGLPHFALNYGITQFAPGFGGLIFTALAEHMAMGEVSTMQCFEQTPLCFQYAYLFSSAALAFALVLAFFLVRQYPPAWLNYQQVASKPEKD